MEEERRRGQEIRIEVPEHTAVQIVLAWKVVWQCGNAHVQLSDGSIEIVPYEVVMRTTFDQKTLDVTT